MQWQHSTADVPSGNSSSSLPCVSTTAAADFFLFLVIRMGTPPCRHLCRVRAHSKHAFGRGLGPPPFCCTHESPFSTQRSHGGWIRILLGRGLGRRAEPVGGSAVRRRFAPLTTGAAGSKTSSWAGGGVLSSGRLRFVEGPGCRPLSMSTSSDSSLISWKLGTPSSRTYEVLPLPYVCCLPEGGGKS